MGHCKFAHVDYGALRHVGVFVAVDICAFPALGIYVKFGFFFFCEERFEIFCRVADFDGVRLSGYEVVVLRVVLSGKSIVLGWRCYWQH